MSERGPRCGPPSFGPGHGPPWVHKNWQHRRRFSSRFRGFRIAMLLLFAGGMLGFAYLLARACLAATRPPCSSFGSADAV